LCKHGVASSSFLLIHERASVRASFCPSRALFQALAAQRQAGAFDVTADGKKFLINSGNQKEGNVNWPAELKK
jgi:hypothetical protein